MRKRILAGILAAVLSLSLAACGDTKQTASTETETVQAQDGEKGLKELFEEGKKTLNTYQMPYRPSYRYQ